MHDFWAQIVAGGPSSPDEVRRPQRLPDPELPARCADALARVVGVLDGADPSGAVRTWDRMAQETAVHRWDAEDATAGLTD